MRTDSQRTRGQRGSTILEALLAMALIMTGAAGLIGLNNVGIRLDADGRRITRATAIAEDLAAQIALWPYTDPRLVNTNRSNEDDPGDAAANLQLPGAATAWVDYGGFDSSGRGEPSLTLGGTEWHGIPSADVVSGGFERYWSISENDPARPGSLLDANGNTVPDGIRVAAIVRWPAGAGWRRVVILVNKINPADTK
jgi:hypothetical protein